MELGLFEKQTGEKRHGRLGYPPSIFPRWRPGVPVAGKRLLVWPEQGFGDAIMALRYARPAADAGAEIVLVAAAELAPLFEGQVPWQVLARGKSFEIPWVDLACTDFDLMRAYLTAQRPIPPPFPLRGDATRVGGIGIAWRGDPGHPNDANRSLPRHCADTLLALPRAVSLLPEDTGATDFQQTADLIAGLDHVISVDTSIAHLAGSMGKPVTLLLPAANLDWRWPPTGNRTPWYPSVQIVRQGSTGAWDKEIDRLAQAWTS